MGKASIGTWLERLEAGGFIERRPDLTDKRARRVSCCAPPTRLVKKLTIEEANSTMHLARPIALGTEQLLTCFR